MKQANTSETMTPKNRKIGIPGLDALAGRPRTLAIALGFTSASAVAAAMTFLLWEPDTPGRMTAPEVSMARLAPVPEGRTRHAPLSEVVRRLPRAQTWHPPHQLPAHREQAALPELERDAPEVLPMPHLEMAPTPDLRIAPEALASLPNDVTITPDPEVRKASMMPQDAAVPAIRPRARPALDLPEPAQADGLVASLRPRARPAGLRVPQGAAPAVAEAEAPAPTLAAMPRGIERAASGAVCNSRLTRAIPTRRGGAEGGKQVMAGLMAVGGTDRDRSVTREILSGNMPSFLQDLVPVKVTGRARDGSSVSIVFCAMPDYLAVGSDSDFVRVPMGMPAATRIASQFDMLLPTRRMVDQIYRAADLRVAPQPMTPGPQMTSTDYFLRHNATVEGQVHGSSRGGALVSGHKKDLVLTNRLNRNRGRVAIYGWHRTNGKAIQPLSTVHGANYADYSHGIRLISQTAYLNGRPVRLADLFADPTYAELISDEGPIRAAQLQLASAN